MKVLILQDQIQTIALPITVEIIIATDHLRDTLIIIHTQDLTTITDPTEITIEIISIVIIIAVIITTVTDIEVEASIAEIIIIVAEVTVEIHQITGEADDILTETESHQEITIIEEGISTDQSQEADHTTVIIAEKDQGTTERNLAERYPDHLTMNKGMI